MALLSTALSNVYIALASAKLAQWLILRNKQKRLQQQQQKAKNEDEALGASNKYKKNDNESSSSSSTTRISNQKQPRVQAGNGPMEFSPSLQALMYVYKFYLQEDVNKKPRKKFRQITDPMLEAYRDRLKTRKPKTFHSLNDALRDCYREFCQDDNTWQVDCTKYIVACFLRHPLGLVAMGDIILTICTMPLFMLRESLWMGGNANTFFCKAAASGTINEVYVVCCKENISFEAALHGYPWLNGAFSKPQLHPMIGTSVCPVFRRRVEVPTKDVMNFDIEVLECPTGTAVLRQKHDNFWANFLEDASASYGLVLTLVMALIYFEGTSGILAVSKWALPFYVVRVLVDRDLDLRWMDQFFFLP